MPAGGYSCPPRALKLQVGPVHAPAVNHGQKICSSSLQSTQVARFTKNQETPSHTRRLGQSHQLFQLGLRMDHHFYCCFFTHYHLLASSSTNAPTQPFPCGSTPGNASGIIPPSSSHRKYSTSLTNGYTRKQSKKIK